MPPVPPHGLTTKWNCGIITLYDFLSNLLYIRSEGVSRFRYFDGGEWGLAKKRKVKMSLAQRDKSIYQEENVA